MASYAENVSIWWRHHDILQGHFAATGSSYDSPITREANLKNMNEYVMWTYKQGWYLKNQENKANTTVCILYGI